MSNKWITSSLIVLLSFGLFIQCSSSQSSKASFVGTWVTVDENTIMSITSRKTIQVYSDGDRFRIETHANDQGFEVHRTEVFDGTQLHLKVVTTVAGESSESDVTSHTPKKTELTALQFWKTDYSGSTKSGTGTPISGRDTVRYEVKDKRPDGELTGQAWLDAETNILLKQTFTVYSKQIESKVVEFSKQCQSIQYQSVQDSFFLKP